MTNRLKNQHLLWRAGFGPSVEMIGDLDRQHTVQVYKALVKASSKKPTYINVADNYLKGLVMGIGEAGKMQRKDIPEEQKKKIQQQNRRAIRSLNLYWMNEMVNTRAQLREKMSFFWHGHFACRNLNVFYQQGLLDVIRRNALGSFRTLLHEVSKTAAMLFFLNNQQNRKDSPNENFAREVMELFTLGRGHYSEKDIKEAARAFTGWTANLNGEFVFRKMQHDAGIKTVLGKTGNFDGDDVLDILLEQKQTARFLARKMYRFFVHDTVDEEKTEWLAARFYQSNYNISGLLDDIFSSEWFYDEKNIGSKIKSPVELLVGMQRMLPMTIQREENLLLLQHILGQVLFYPPNVAGWPGGKAWIDSSSLIMRLRIPQLINDTDEWNIKAKDDDDQMMGRGDDDNNAGNTKKPQQHMLLRQRINAEVDWKQFVKKFETTEKNKLLQTLSSVLLQCRSRLDHELMYEYTDSVSREQFIKSATLRMMSTPEYQLC